MTKILMATALVAAMLGGLIQDAAAQHVGGDAHHHEHQAGEQRDQGIGRVQQEQHDQKDRHPCRFQRHRHRVAAEEAPELAQVTDRLAGPVVATFQRARHGGLQGRHVEPLHQPGGDGHEDPCANELENAEDDEGARCDHDQHGQRVEIMTVEHPVVDLQHE